MSTQVVIEVWVDDKQQGIKTNKQVIVTEDDLARLVARKIQQSDRAVTFSIDKVSVRNV